jgi:hypothetical protein
MRLGALRSISEAKGETNRLSVIMNGKLGLNGIVSVFLHFNSEIGVWSRSDESPESFIRLEPKDLLLLCQFRKLVTRVQAAEAVGYNYGPEFDALIDKFVQAGLVSEGYPVDEPFYRLRHPEPRVDFIAFPGAIGDELSHTIRSGLLSSGLIGANHLPAAFQKTHGFGIRFRREALPQVRVILPCLEWFLARLLDPTDAATLLGNEAIERAPNAFALNVLLIPPGGGTALHLDKTLGVSPRLVSVLYLQGHCSSGGQLYLIRRGIPAGVVNPRPGMLVHFRGDLMHGVSESVATTPRLSLVCEQFVLDEARLKRAPFLSVDRNLTY